MSAIETDRLERRYGRRWALRDCSLAVPAGRVVGLVGPNGAGKTTLLHMAVGLLAPTAGSIRVLGGLPPRERPGQLRRVGFVAQDKPLYRGFRVADMLRFGAKLNPGWDQDQAVQRLSRLGIPLSQRAGQLSGGQQAQLALALALGKRPELLVLDEPVANLDPLARREFLQLLMGEAAQGGLSVVLSSHLVADLERICDYLILLAAGQVQLVGDADDLLAEHRMFAGPRDQAGLLGRTHTVVHASYTGRQATLLVRLRSPAPDLASWTVRPVSLEELVLGYMSGPPPAQAAPSLSCVSEVPA